MHRHVDAAVPFERHGVHALVVLGQAHVRTDEDAADLVGDVLAAGHVHDHDSRALVGQAPADGGADAAPGAGDHRDTSVEAVHSGVTYAPVMPPSTRKLLAVM